MGFLKAFFTPINWDALAEKGRVHAEERRTHFPFTAKKPVAPGLYHIVAYSKLKSQGVHRWRVTAGRGHKSFNIDFPLEVIFQQPLWQAFNGRFYTRPTGSLVRLTETHADPSPITNEDRQNALPIL
jgi:hypothetical protein